uniref:Uncharacterized protein n=1 Tax=Quercus lobata TaxID=97700 RepID=A0A7N2LIX0_QUELO
MMAKKSGSLDYWRNYFRTANSDIFEIIDHAITAATSDCPKEVELPVPCGGGEDDETEEEDDSNGGCKSSGFERGGCEFEPGWSKESKNSCLFVCYSSALVVKTMRQKKKMTFEPSLAV